MRKMLAIHILTCLLFAATAAQAGPGDRYFSAGLGLAMLNDSTMTEPGLALDVDFDAGPGLTMAVGREFSGGRAEVELFYRKNAINSFTGYGVSLPASGDATAKGMMINLCHDFQEEKTVSPFLGFGAGFARLELEDAAILGIPLGEADDTVFAWQLLAGLGLQVSETMTLDLAYRYFATADPEYEGTKAEYVSHNLLAAIRVAF